MKKIAVLATILLAGLIYSIGELGAAANETLNRGTLVEQVQP